MKFSSVAILLLSSFASAGYISLSTASGRSTDTGDANKGCFGPVAGKGPYKITAHGGLKPKELRIYAGKDCKEPVLAKCKARKEGDCQSLSGGSSKMTGAVWGWFA
ncbi:hypothetical protein CPSG_01438 [Coccidioides posadasii str. Silveira]|uniref:Uncharacterized protein n=1 Tax=Coccidioides posadasii (strain RMSCC 757 / Silveira) TaxID=443226 RepID=E9CVE3_COCPS|nr:hypothetical protein CPSG_01438 [Coccidioides posadasii str. Silveira]